MTNNTPTPRSDEVDSMLKSLGDTNDEMRERRVQDYAIDFYKDIAREKSRRDAKRAVDEMEHRQSVSQDELTPLRALRGGDAILDQPDMPPAVWGLGQQVAWAKGQGMMLAGHQGLGKTTLAQQLVLARIGVLPSHFLGLPVVPDPRPVLYLAMDRPSQALQSFRRMVMPEHRQTLNDSMIVWSGPLPVNPIGSRDALADFVAEVTPNCGLVVVDSVKDLAPGVSDDAVGSALNIAWQEVIARGTELLLLHHERKAANGSKRHNTLDDIYGSTWLTSGLGSVFALEGEPGSPTVTLNHLKQVNEPIGPLTLRHHHASGRTTTHDSKVTVLSFLTERGVEGATVREVASAVLGRAADADLQKIRRELNKHLQSNLLKKQPGAKTAKGAAEDHWFVSGYGTFTAGVVRSLDDD